MVLVMSCILIEVEVEEKGEATGVRVAQIGTRSGRGHMRSLDTQHALFSGARGARREAQTCATFSYHLRAIEIW